MASLVVFLRRWRIGGILPYHQRRDAPPLFRGKTYIMATTTTRAITTITRTFTMDTGITVTAVIPVTDVTIAAEITRLVVGLTRVACTTNINDDIE